MPSVEYLAGFFDGEGCIDVQRCYPRAGKGRLYVRPRVRLCLADSGRYLLEQLQTQYGGHLVNRASQSKTQQSSSSWEMLSGDAMKRFLAPMVPYLVLKCEQAKLVLWWLDNAKSKYTRRSFDYTPMRQLFSDELKAMKVDPQRLSERAVPRILALMRQSDLPGDRETAEETAAALAGVPASPTSFARLVVTERRYGAARSLKSSIA